MLLVFLLWQEDNFGSVIGTAETLYNIIGYLSYRIAVLNSKSE